MTSVKTFKKEHKVIDNEIVAKKDLPTNNVQSDKETSIIEKPKTLLEIIKSLSDEDLNNVIDLASQELAIRGQQSMTG